MNPYYNQEMSNNSYGNFLQGAQSVGQGLWQNPSMWASNPYVAAAGLGADVLSRPLQSTNEQRNRMDSVSNTRLPDEQFDSYGNEVYNLGGAETGLNEAQEDLDSYYDLGAAYESGDHTLLDEFNPLNLYDNAAKKVRTTATSDLGRKIIPKGLNFIAKNQDKEQRIIDAQRQNLTERREGMSEHNINNTNQRNQQFQSSIDRRRRLNNLNKVNVY